MALPDLSCVTQLSVFSSVTSKVQRAEPPPTSSQCSQSSSVRLPSWRRRPGPVSVGRRQRGGTGHRPAVPGGRRLSASSASQRACWPQTEGLRPVGHPSLEFYLVGPEDILIKPASFGSLIKGQFCKLSLLTSFLMPYWKRQKTTKKTLSFTERGEGGGVQGVPGQEFAVGGRRTVGDKNIVVVIGGERQREAGQPGRITDVWEDVVCIEGNIPK